MGSGGALGFPKTALHQEPTTTAESRTAPSITPAAPTTVESTRIEELRARIAWPPSMALTCSAVSERTSSNAPVYQPGTDQLRNGTVEVPTSTTWSSCHAC